MEMNGYFYAVYNREDILAFEPLKEVVKGIFPQKGLAAIYGPPESGKSFLALDMAAAIAEGQQWFGHRTIQSLVVYLILEGGAGFSKRVAAWEVSQGRQIHPGLVYVTGERPKGSKMPPKFELTSQVDVAQLAATVNLMGAKNIVFFIDTLNRAAPAADENSSDGMGASLEGLKALQAATDSLVVIIHHSGKDESRGMRGHSSLLGAIDASLVATRESWASGKTKDFAGGKNEGYALKVVDVGVDEDGDLITSCVVEPTGEFEPTEKKARLTGKWQKHIASQLELYLKENGDAYIETQSKGRPSIPKEALIDIAMDNAPETVRRDALQRALDAMCYSGYLGSTQYRVWIAP